MGNWSLNYQMQYMTKVQWNPFTWIIWRKNYIEIEFNMQVGIFCDPRCSWIILYEIRTWPSLLKPKVRVSYEFPNITSIYMFEPVVVTHIRYQSNSSGYVTMGYLSQWQAPNIKQQESWESSVWSRFRTVKLVTCWFRTLPVTSAFVVVLL